MYRKTLLPKTRWRLNLEPRLAYLMGVVLIISTILAGWVGWSISTNNPSVQTGAIVKLDFTDPVGSGWVSNPRCPSDQSSEGIPVGYRSGAGITSTATFDDNGMTRQVTLATQDGSRITQGWLVEPRHDTSGGYDALRAFTVPTPTKRVTVQTPPIGGSERWLICFTRL